MDQKLDGAKPKKDPPYTLSSLIEFVTFRFEVENMYLKFMKLSLRDSLEILGEGNLLPMINKYCKSIPADSKKRLEHVIKTLKDLL